MTVVFLNELCSSKNCSLKFLLSHGKYLCVCTNNPPWGNNLRSRTSRQRSERMYLSPMLSEFSKEMSPTFLHVYLYCHEELRCEMLNVSALLRHRTFLIRSIQFRPDSMTRPSSQAGTDEQIFFLKKLFTNTLITLIIYLILLFRKKMSKGTIRGGGGGGRRGQLLLKLWRAVTLQSHGVALIKMC